MPDLGKAVYTLALETAQYAAGWDEAEAQATEATAKIGQQLTLLDGSFGKVGEAAGAAAVETTAATDEIAAGAGKAGAASSAAADKAALSWTKASATIKEKGKIGGGMGPLIGLGAAYIAIKSGIDEIKQSNIAIALTQSHIKSTGAIAGVTATHVEQLADKWARVAGTQRDVTESADAILLTFPRVRDVMGKHNDIFDQADTAVQNLARSYHMQLSRAAILVGKALNDPTRGMTMLRRVGVSLSQQQTDLVKKLIATGHGIEAQKLILRELSKETGGAAAAYGKTFAGQIAIARAELTKSSATIISSFIPAVADAAGTLKAVAQVMSHHTKLLRDLILGYIAYRTVLFGARTVIMGVETAMKIANAMTMTLGKSTRATTTATKELGTAEAVTAGKTEAAGAAAATASGELDAATASTKAFRLSTIAAGTSLGAILGPLALATAAYVALKVAINDAKSAEKTRDEAISREGSLTSARNAYYAQRVKTLMKGGMSRKAADSQARIDTAKHLGASMHGAGPGAAPAPTAAALNKEFAASLGKGKDKKGKALIPVDFQIAQAQAQLTSGLSDDEKAYEAELKYLKDEVAHRKMTKAQELSVLQEMVAVNSSINTIRSQMATKAKAQAAKAKKEATAAWKAVLTPVGLTTTLQKAEATKSLKDDEKALHALVDYYNGLLKNRKMTKDQILAVQKKLTAATKAIAADQKKEAAARKKAHTEYVKELKMEQAALDMRGTFLGQFASSVFHAGVGGLTPGAQTAGLRAGKVVTVTQNNNYNEIPRDRHETARKMRVATEAAMN